MSYGPLKLKLDRLLLTTMQKQREIAENDKQAMNMEELLYSVDAYQRLLTDVVNELEATLGLF